MLKGELWLLSCISHTTCQEVKATKPTPAYLCTSRNNALCAKLLQLCLTLCSTVGCSLPGSSVHGILQARILVWVAIPFSSDLSNPGLETRSPELQSDYLLSDPPGKPKKAPSGIVTIFSCDSHHSTSDPEVCV